jgi:hypothetical protein
LPAGRKTRWSGWTQRRQCGDPTQARDRADLGQLRAYLDDESVPPLVIRRLVERHPGGADQIFGNLLRKPGFLWSRDGEKLLRCEKRQVPPQMKPRLPT